MGSALLAGYTQLAVHADSAFPQPAFDQALGSTWRIVAGSLAAFALSETLDNGLGAWMRGRFPDWARVLGTNAVSVPLDSLVFIAIAFGLGSLGFVPGPDRSQNARNRADRPPTRLPDPAPARGAPAESRSREAGVPAVDHGQRQRLRRRGGSVLEHRFGQSDPYTLGVEEEYMLLDAETFDLVQHIDTVLAAIEGDELEPQIKAELMQSVLEIATPVCHTPADVAAAAAQAARLRRRVARAQGLRFGSAGTHPFSPLRAAADHGAATATAPSSTSSSTSRGAS